MKRFILIVQCLNRKGIVAAVSTYLAENDASIIESHQSNDASVDQFFMRVVFCQDGPDFPSIAELRSGFEPIASKFAMAAQFFDAGLKPRVLIAVSKFGHCLFDLLHRWRTGLWPVEIAAVISNHDDLRSFVEWNGIPFHHLPMSEGKSAQETRFMDIASANDVDLVVLARYMQILSPALCAKLSGRCINIHHSFLPSFKGAKPYHQAYARGVKVIGATAHYVTTDLDEGPIIEQDVERVHHGHAPEDLVAIGRDIECRVLARAVQWHAERRIVVTGGKSIVFA